MVQFILAFRVQLLVWTVFLAPANSNKIKGNLPDLGVISSFLEQFIKPYIEHIHVNSGSNKAAEAVEETKIDKVIRFKVAEVKPYLQDDEDKPKTETEDNLTLQGNDETTVVEFVPKNNVRKNKSKIAYNSETDTFKNNISKYKQLRKSIKKVLEKEGTATSTKNLITRTLDEMLATMIESQCTWKGVDPIDIKHHLLRSDTMTRRSMKKLRKLTNKEWTTLRKQYLNFLKFNDGDNQRDGFMKQFHEFFTTVINDTWNLSNRYKVRCQLVKVTNPTKNKPSKTYLREDKLVEKNQCDSFKVCSVELKDFLTNFYRYLNDTAVSTFRNYAAMYIRDVNADIGLDKDIVVSVLENLSNTAERKVSKIFKKEVEKLTLDGSKNKGANIQHIREFIIATTDQVKKVLKKTLDYELGAMKTKLFSTVKDDLIVNLQADMFNLGKQFVDRICALFVLCNGKYPARRQDEPWIFTPKTTDNVYVKVQLTLDDEMKESIARIGSFPKPWQGKDMTHRFVKNFGIDDMKYSNVNVTRTTLSTTTDAGNLSKSSLTSKKTLPVKEITVYGGITVMVNNQI